MATHAPTARPLPPNLMETELGIERRCARCREFWPADDPEFWQRITKRGRPAWHAYCRACLSELGHIRRSRTPGSRSERASGMG